MKTIPEIVIYKYLTKDDIIELLTLALFGRGSSHISKDITATVVLDGRVELEIIEKDYEIDE